MLNKLVGFLILAFTPSISNANEQPLLEKITSHQAVKHAVNIAKEIWSCEITTLDNNVVSVSNVVIGIFLLVIGFMLAKFLSYTIRKRMLGLFQLDDNASSAIEKFIYYILLVLITLTALDIANIPLSGLTFIGGALAIGVGFGSQNILNNFISGIIIMIESPISVGDIIEIDGKIAVVMNIGARCVHLKTYDNIDLLVPNSTIIQNNITNWTLEDNVIRVTTSFLIDGDCSPSITSSLLKQAMDENVHIVNHQEAVVCLSKFDIYGMNFDIYFFISTTNLVDRKRILSDLNIRIHELFSKNKIYLSYYKDMYNGKTT